MIRPTKVKKSTWNKFLLRLNSFPFTETERIEMINEVISRFNVNPKWVRDEIQLLRKYTEFNRLPLYFWPYEVRQLYRLEQARLRRLEKDYL